jgi:hypothetical protein
MDCRIKPGNNEQAAQHPYLNLQHPIPQFNVRLLSDCRANVGTSISKCRRLLNIW